MATSPRYSSNIFKRYFPQLGLLLLLLLVLFGSELLGPLFCKSPGKSAQALRMLKQKPQDEQQVLNFEAKEEKLKIMPLDYDQVPVNQAIFFLVTDTPVTLPVQRQRKIWFGRELCALEAAARSNPEAQIYVLIDSTSNLDKIPEYMLRLENVHFKTFVVKDLLEKGPSSGDALSLHVKSKTDPRFTSLLLRYYVLYAFGGTYFDFDLLAIKPMPKHELMVVAETSSSINSAVLRATKNNAFLQKVIKQLLNSGYEGFGKPIPDSITPVVNEVCLDGSGKVLWERDCSGSLTVLDPSKAYGIEHENWLWFHDNSKTDELNTKIKPSFSVHYWNEDRMAANNFLHNIRGDHPLYQLFIDHCPIVEKHILRLKMGDPY